MVNLVDCPGVNNSKGEIAIKYNVTDGANKVKFLTASIDLESPFDESFDVNINIY